MRTQIRWDVRYTRIGQVGVHRTSQSTKREAVKAAKAIKADILLCEGYTVHGNIQRDECYWVYCNGIQVATIELMRVETWA
jgi:hypothetical protein